MLIHGEVVHKSEHNCSSKSREIYAFHMYDQAQCVYDDKNWSVSFLVLRSKPHKGLLDLVLEL